MKNSGVHADGDVDDVLVEDSPVRDDVILADVKHAGGGRSEKDAPLDVGEIKEQQSAPEEAKSDRLHCSHCGEWDHEVNNCE